MKANEVLWVLGIALFWASCSHARSFWHPTIATVKSPADGATTKIIAVGYFENMEEAKSTLLTDVRKTCPNFQIVAEGIDYKDRYGVFNEETARQKTSFSWVRYQCHRHR
ncbi:MAG: hypothetical protein ACRERD_20980 [Candidatus Binatia bacterium]